MHAVLSGANNPTSRAILFCDPTRNCRSGPISSRRARYTRTTASTLATGVSFTTPVSRTDGGADRWRTFLSNVSPTATASGFDVTSAASVLAQWWRGRARAWANAAIAF
jgi:hypothetical protein